MTSILHPFQPRGESPLPEEWLRWLGCVLASRGGPLPLPPDTDWHTALPAIETHALAPLLYTTLKDASGSRAIPAGALAALTAAFQASATRTLRLELEIERVTATLAANGAPCLLLKGAALGRTVYASPAERPVSDLDLLVPRNCLADAQRVLDSLGYRCLSAPAGGRLGRWLYRYRAESVSVGRTAPNQGLLVETHWTLTELPYYIERIDIVEAWRTALPAPGLSHAQIPDPAVLLVHACAHLTLHHSRDLRLIWLIDLDRLVDKSDLDWARVIDLADAWGLGLAVSTCLDVAGRWLGTPAPDAVRAELTRLAADPAGRAMWGLGDETLAGRWWRRAWATWDALDARQRVRYTAWLALRVLLRPVEWRRWRHQPR